MAPRGKKAAANKVVSGEAAADSERTGEAAEAGGAQKLPAFVREQIEDAQKRLLALESEAQKVLQNLIVRGQKSRAEVEALLGRLQGMEQVKEAKKLGKKATAARAQAQKRLNELQSRVIESVGVASGAQVKEINREIAKLSKKIDTLVKKPASKSGPDARA